MKLVVALLIVTLSFVTHRLHAQISTGGTPPSFSSALTSAVPNVTMTAVDTQALLIEDSLSGNDPYRFAAQINVSLGLKNAGVWEKLSNGDRVWRLRIVSPGAYSIGLLYNEWQLPKGGQLFIYNDDRGHVIGAFTDFNNWNGTNVTQHVAGDAITLEYIEPSSIEGQTELKISAVCHAYRNVFGRRNPLDAFGQSGPCNFNVNCPEGANWQREKRAVVLIVSDGWRLCSGSLINNTRLDATPYLLTAHHCLDGNQGNWVFYFNYESSTCTSSQDGDSTHTVANASLRATWCPNGAGQSSDFALLEMTNSIPPSYNPYFCGWNRTEAVPANTVGIHHPKGDVKKISIDNAPSSSVTVGVPLEAPCADPVVSWRVHWDTGVTEVGSSGSPLFNDRHKVIGQLLGAADTLGCFGTKVNYYGKFVTSWSGGGTPATRLSDWLDPLYCGVDSLNGMEGSEPGNIIRWTAANSPYYICVLDILAGQTLIIESGVHIFIRSQINVYGRVEASGVVFDGLGGIGVGIALDLQGDAQAIIENCQFQHFGIAGVVHSSSNSLVVSNCGYTDCWAGIESWNAPLTLNSCTFTDIPGWWVVQSSVALSVANCTFTRCRYSVVAYSGANTIEDCSFTGSDIIYHGCGIQMFGTSSRVSRCNLTIGSIIVNGEGPVVEDCSLLGGSASAFGDGAVVQNCVSQNSGYISVNGTNAMVQNCNADSSGIAAYGNGAVVQNCRSSHGNGIIIGGMNAIVLNCVSDSSNAGVTIYDGAAVRYSAITGCNTGIDGTGSILHCAVVGCQIGMNGTGIIQQCTVNGCQVGLNGASVIRNCAIVNCQTGVNGYDDTYVGNCTIVNCATGATFPSGGILQNNIFFNNTYGYHCYPFVLAQNNLFAGNYRDWDTCFVSREGEEEITNLNGDSCDANFNLFTDPQFVNADSGDFRLRCNSPCIDAGDPGAPPDSDGTTADIGASFFPQIGPRPRAPQLLTVLRLQNPTRFQLNWWPVTEDELGQPIAVAHYEIHRSSNAGFVGPFTKLGTTDGETTYVDNVSASQGDKFFYRVVAVSCN